MKLFENQKRFSFLLDGKDGFSFPHTVRVKTQDNITETVYDFECGLRITNIAKKYDDFGGYEWVNYFENTSDTPAGIISELYDCDALLPMEHEQAYNGSAYMPSYENATKIFAPAGSAGTRYEFNCEIDSLFGHWPKNHVLVGQTRKYSTSGGRSSNNEYAPFFNIHKNGAGHIIAIGWTGQWNCEISRNVENVCVKTCVEGTNFRILPNEKFRTSSIVILPYKGSFIESQNKWRRFVKKHFSIIGKEGRPAQGPLFTGFWGGLSTDSCLEKIETIKENKFPFEYIWMDAGWYGDTSPTPDEYEGDWWKFTGDWRVSTKSHPDGLLQMREKMADLGKKFVLWFEPERVRTNVPIAKEHPEYFLSYENDPDNLLLDLGNEDAWNYCYNTLCEHIEKLRIDCYRQDFNFEPLGFWRKKDAEDRRGISEIKHINGMYKLWDTLLERFPNLLIDNCASGGRRIDIETLRRSIPLWRSDLQCPANYDIEGTQNHGQSFPLWLPYSGTGSGRSIDEYRIRSAYAPALTTNYFYSDKEKYDDIEKKHAFIAKYSAEFLKVRPYLTEDFYPLTELSMKNDTWCANQYDSPETMSGMVQIFRRPDSPYESACLKLYGLCADAEYIFEDADGGNFEAKGSDLLEGRFAFTVAEKRKAKIYFYKQK